MAEFMAQVDAKATHRAGDQHHGQHAMPGQAVMRHKPGTEDERTPQNGHQEVGDPAVVGVGIELGHRAFRRVAQVFTQQPVQQRRNQVEKGHRNPQAERVPAEHHQRRAKAHSAGNQQGQQPRVAFTVPVRSGCNGWGERLGHGACPAGEYPAGRAHCGGKPGGRKP